MTDREDLIRQRAYSIWEEEGHPHGRADDHWHRAVRETTGAEGGAGPARAETLPDLGTAPDLQTADAPPEAKPAARRRKVTDPAPTTPRRRAVKKS